jgi:hypothetical protein
MTNKAPILPESFAMTHTSEQEENEGEKIAQQSSRTFGWN